MTTLRHVAVLDVGKSNAKVALVDAATLEEIDLARQPNRVRHAGPWPHFDLDGLWAFFADSLARFHRSHGIDAISVTTHGASAALLDAGGALAAPMLDYEFDGPDTVTEAYDRIRPPFAETGSPRLGLGLNLGAQFHWQFVTVPALRERTAHVVTYPQYWGFRLTGEIASDVTSLGCHTDLWNPHRGAFSPLVERLGLAGKMAPPRRPSEILGALRPELCTGLGLHPGTPVTVGIHDSNASLLPNLVGRSPPFAVVSTGTWVIAMAIGGEKVDLPPERDTLVNVNAFGDPVPSARFMGGREFETICGPAAGPASDAALATVLAEDIILLPAVEPGSGPFQNRAARWTRTPRNDQERNAAASLYLALMTETCLRLAGARGVTLVEGPLATNTAYLAMLAALRPDPVEATLSATGTSTGAALLALGHGGTPRTRRIPKPGGQDHARYAASWFARTGPDPHAA